MERAVGRARGADHGKGGWEGDAGLHRRATRDIGDDGGRSLSAARAHGGPRSFSATEHATLRVSDGHGGVRAAAVDAEQDRPFRHVAPPICPSAHLPDTTDEIIPTKTVTAVPSGTYHGHARPGSQRTGKCRITAPNTIGDMTTMLTMSAMMTSRSR